MKKIIIAFIITSLISTGTVATINAIPKNYEDNIIEIQEEDIKEDIEENTEEENIEENEEDLSVPEVEVKKDYSYIKSGGQIDRYKIDENGEQVLVEHKEIPQEELHFNSIEEMVDSFGDYKNFVKRSGYTWQELNEIYTNHGQGYLSYMLSKNQDPIIKQSVMYIVKTQEKIYNAINNA